MKVFNTEINGVLLIEINTFRDNRGLFFESYQKRRYFDFGIEDNFEQDNFSSSAKNVIRGLHFQKKNSQSQLLTILNGSIFDVLVDLRKSSPTFKKWISVDLKDNGNIRQIYMPPGIAHGFCVLSNQADLNYKVNKNYIPKNEAGIHWADNELKIKWPISDPILSVRDDSYPSLSELSIQDLPNDL